MTSSLPSSINETGEKEKRSEESVAKQLVENMKEEQDNPIVRSPNDKQQGMVNQNQHGCEFESYLARIAKATTKLVAQKGASGREELSAPNSSQPQQISISSSRLSVMLSDEQETEAANSNANRTYGNSTEKDESTNELLQGVRKLLQEYEQESATLSHRSLNGEDQKELSPESSSLNGKGASIESIIQALAKVKVATSESHSVRSNASGDKRKRGLCLLLSPRSKNHKTSDNTVITPKSKRIVFGEDSSLSNGVKKLKQKLRSPRPPISPMSNNALSTSKSAFSNPSPRAPFVTTSPRAPSQHKPPLSPARVIPKPIDPPVSTDLRNNTCVADAVQKPLEPSKTPASSDSETSRILNSSPKTNQGVEEILHWTDSVSGIPARGNSPKKTSLKLFVDHLEVDGDAQTALELGILSSNHSDNSNAQEEEGEPALSPVARVQVTNWVNPAGIKRPKREIDDILKWTDESRVLEVNKTLTPKNIPKEGPAWGFIHGNNNKKKNLRERATNAVKVLRRGRASDAAPKPSSYQRNNASNVSEFVSAQNYSSNEMKESIEEPQAACAADLSAIETETSSRTPSKLSTADRIDALIPTLDAVGTRETTSVACSRSTAPVANRGCHDLALPSLGSPPKPSPSRVQPAPIIEFQEDQLEGEKSLSFSTYDTEDFVDTDDEGTSRSGEAKSPVGNPMTRLEMSFSQSMDSPTSKKKLGSFDGIRSISDLSSVFMEETAAVADELRSDMSSIGRTWFCFV